MPSIFQAAVIRIQTLQEASEDELNRYNDVCSICYSDMRMSAKVTPCGHYFHGGCLKKWLFVQDHCPMCAAKVIEEPPEDPSDAVQEEVVEVDNDGQVDDDDEGREGVNN